MNDAAHTIIQIPDSPAVTIGIVVFFLGAFLTRHVTFLRSYNIPEPVSGGLAVAVLIGSASLIGGHGTAIA